jgi:hypothetical protein
MHDLVDGQVGQRRVVHEGKGHGVEHDVDAARVGRHRPGVVRHGAFVERVEERNVDALTDVARHLLERSRRPAGQVHACTGIGEGTRDGAADRTAAPVDGSGLVLQQHPGLLCVCVKRSTMQTPPRRRTGRDRSAHLGRRPVSVPR